MRANYFDGKRYNNKDVPTRSLWHVFYWMLTRNPVKWPSRMDIKQQKIENQRVGPGEATVTFINHSTVLLQISGWNVLTDPIWSERASPFSWIGPKRVSLPGVKFEDLPPIDLVLLSHNHYDHMDIPTLKRLEQEHQPVFYVPQGNRLFLEKKGLTYVQDMQWWQEVNFSVNYKLVFVPAQHFSARGLWDHNKTLWGGFFIKGKDFSTYFAGDTGYGKHFKEIKQRLGSPDLALLPIGAYKPEWMMQPVHMNPKEAIQAHLDLEAYQSIPIHFGTFPLSDEGIDEPIEELQRELNSQKIPLERFRALKQGESKKLNNL